jgi:single-stranded-DNA-specific exonuclease
MFTNEELTSRNINFEQNKLNTKLVGVTFNDRQKVISGLNEGELLTLARQFDNEYDVNAVLALRSDGKEVGHIRRELAQELAPAMDKGCQYICEVKQITGGGELSKGVNIEIKKLSETLTYNCFTCARNYKTKTEAENCCKI